MLKYFYRIGPLVIPTSNCLVNTLVEAHSNGLHFLHPAEADSCVSAEI